MTMSQDTGLRRPRETIAGTSYNFAMPQSASASASASAMKRSHSTSIGGGAPYSSGHTRSMSGSRLSLALSRPAQPTFTRTSFGGNVADVGVSSVKRLSSQIQSTSMLKSYTPAPLPSRTPTDATERRSSIYRARTSTHAHAAGHQSFFQQAAQPAGVPRDPRPLRDRAHQARIGQELLDYLAHNNFEMEMNYSLSPNVMKSPTQKDFVYMFQWLYHRIDPSYKFLKNIDQEVPPLLKQLRYPYERSITKSQIAAVGGQNWYTFLGVLHWMMQLAQILDAYAANRYDEACLEAGVDVTGDHIIFNFLSKAYGDWLAMGEETTDEEAEKILAPHVQEMAQAFAGTSSRYQHELQMLEAEQQRLQREMEDLEKNTPDPATLDNHHRIMEEDRIKFEEYNTLAMQRSEKYEKRTHVLQEEVEKTTQELRQSEEDRRGLQKAVDDQGISMADIDRMTSERERLQKGIESASQRLDDVKKKVADKEVEASRKLDDLERLVDRYNAVAYQLGLMPATAVNAKGTDWELRVTVNEEHGFTAARQEPKGSSGDGYEKERLVVNAHTGYLPGHILNLDVRGQVKSAFLNLRKEISERRGQAMETMMKDHELLENIKEAMEDKRNEVEALEHRVRAAEEEHEKTKEMTTAQRMASDAQIEKMEKELAKMRASLSESVQLLEQKEMNVTIEYDQLTMRANALREELHTEVTHMLNDVIKFKMHIQKSMEDYEGFVADELEKELASEDMPDEDEDEARDVAED